MDLQSDGMGGRFAHEICMEAITPHLLWGTDATCSNFYVNDRQFDSRWGCVGPPGRGVYVLPWYFSESLKITP